ncbi:MAG: leucyl aminopeptidase family protein [Pseudomonadota bacterium]|nr:leucyl aminopeptidase family protein [Pseudomonadota bacterium]
MVFLDCFTTEAQEQPVEITPVTKDTFSDWLASQSGQLANWVKKTGFYADLGKSLILPPEDGGKPLGALLGTEGKNDIWSWGEAAEHLASATYSIGGKPNDTDLDNATLGWALGSYAFNRYRQSKKPISKLAVAASPTLTTISNTAQAIYLTRDLINTPASDMGPGELAACAKDTADRFNAVCKVITGNDLLRDNYPMVHAVGRASTRAPRLIDITWGKPDWPKVTLVGKGVCFDTGGLDLKPSSGMLMMKKDMGGAAHALGLGQLIMANRLNIRLRILIPAVENSVSGDAFRPMDVLKTRDGMSVEIGNTDAEGRLILGDALTEASAEKPDIVINFATLTGAARIALGPDLAVMFSNNDTLAKDIEAGADQCDDPVWRLPLWKPYRRFLDSKIADINNAGQSRFAGAITAALFLEEFVSENIAWAHFDIYGWNPIKRIGRPVGGEAMGLRAVYAMLEKKYSK